MVEIIPGALPSFRIHTVHPRRKKFMLETRHQMEYVASLLVRAGFKYIIGWKDVRGYGISAVQFAEWQTPSSWPYVNLR